MPTLGEAPLLSPMSMGRYSQSARRGESHGVMERRSSRQWLVFRRLDGRTADLTQPLIILSCSQKCVTASCEL